MRGLRYIPPEPLSKRTPCKARGRGAGKRKTSGQNVSRLTLPDGFLRNVIALIIFFVVAGSEKP